MNVRVLFSSSISTSSHNIPNTEIQRQIKTIHKRTQKSHAERKCRALDKRLSSSTTRKKRATKWNTFPWTSMRYTITKWMRYFVAHSDIIQLWLYDERNKSDLKNGMCTMIEWRTSTRMKNAHREYDFYIFFLIHKYLNVRFRSKKETEWSKRQSTSVLVERISSSHWNCFSSNIYFISNSLFAERKLKTNKLKWNNVTTISCIWRLVEHANRFWIWCNNVSLSSFYWMLRVHFQKRGNLVGGRNSLRILESKGFAFRFVFNSVLCFVSVSILIILFELLYSAWKLRQFSHSFPFKWT